MFPWASVIISSLLPVSFLPPLLSLLPRFFSLFPSLWLPFLFVILTAEKATVGVETGKWGHATVMRPQGVVSSATYEVVSSKQTLGLRLEENNSLDPLLLSCNYIGGKTGLTHQNKAFRYLVSQGHQTRNKMDKSWSFLNWGTQSLHMNRGSPIKEHVGTQQGLMWTHTDG